MAGCAPQGRQAEQLLESLFPVYLLPEVLGDVVIKGHPSCVCRCVLRPSSSRFPGVSPHVRSPARKPGQITGEAVGRGSAVSGARDVEEDFNPLGTLPCRSAPHKSASQLAERWGGGWLGLFAKRSGAV